MKFLIYTGDQNDVHSPWQEIVLHQHVKHDMSLKKTASEMSTLFVLICIV